MPICFDMRVTFLAADVPPQLFFTTAVSWMLLSKTEHLGRHNKLPCLCYLSGSSPHVVTASTLKKGMWGHWMSPASITVAAGYSATF